MQANSKTYSEIQQNQYSDTKKYKTIQKYSKINIQMPTNMKTMWKCIRINTQMQETTKTYS